MQGTQSGTDQYPGFLTWGKMQFFEHEDFSMLPIMASKTEPKHPQSGGSQVRSWKVLGQRREVALLMACLDRDYIGHGAEHFMSTSNSWGVLPAAILALSCFGHARRRRNVWERLKSTPADRERVRNLS